MSDYDAITQAREEYFTQYPFDPHEKALLGHDQDGMPAGFFTLPDMDEMQVVAMKYGYEFLATCRDDDDVDEWIASISNTAQSPELMGIIFAHAFRGIAPIVAQIIDNNPGLRETMRGISETGWKKRF